MSSCHAGSGHSRNSRKTRNSQFAIQGDDESEDKVIVGEDDKGRAPCPVCCRNYRNLKRHLVKVCSHFLTSQVLGLTMNEEFYRTPQFIGYDIIYIVYNL
jgi:hypothetical protein